MDFGTDRPDSCHMATLPWRMPPAAWKNLIVRVCKRCWVDNIGLVAAGVAFYGFLAVVPMLGMLVLTYGLVADPATVVRHVMAMIDVLPPDMAVLIGQLLMNAVETSDNSFGIGFLVALSVELYAGGNGAGAIMTALNIAYEEEEKRSLIRFYVIAFAITIGAIFLALVALATTAIVQSLDRILPQISGIALLLGKAGLHAFVLLIAAAVAATLYRYGPSRKNARWQWLTPGSLFTAITWLVLTNGFGFYVTRLVDYSAIYGSIAAIVMVLSWMYLSAYVFLFGAELNAELGRQAVRAFSG
jgi:membrane protein